MPAFAHFYGIKPWEVADMTFDEIDEFKRQYDAYQKSQRNGGAVVKRRR